MELASILDSLRVVSIPMRTKFRGINSREIALIKGPHGWGEFSPFLEYEAIESSKWLASAIESAFLAPPQFKRSEIEINGTIPAIDDLAKIEEIISWYPGAKVFKIKVGGDVRADLARVLAVKKLVPASKLRIDVNGSWSVAQAIELIREIHDEIGDQLEYVEQPVSSIEELRDLKKKLEVNVKIAGDEVIRKSQDPFAIDLNGAIDIMMLKVAPLGGIARALKLADHHGLPLVVSSALESAIGIFHGLRLAAALPKLDFACGLATGALFSDDFARFPIVDGAISVKPPTFDLSRIDDYQVTDERLEWWRNRVTASWEAMN